jgi:hypothetical protein
MKLLAIETSCDETALAILKIKGPATKPAFSVLSHNVASQIALHAQYGGVFPAMAKREHAKNIVPLFEKTLSEANLLSLLSQKQHPDKLQYVRMSRLEKLLEREREMYEQLVPLLSRIKKPKIDAIAVTTGPGTRADTLGWDQFCASTFIHMGYTARTRESYGRTRAFFFGAVKKESKHQRTSTKEQRVGIWSL